MDLQTLFTTKEFNRLHPVKQEILRKLAVSNAHLTPEQLLPQILSINTELSKRNLSFTPEESRLLIRIMEESMSPDERRKVEMLMNMFLH